MGGDHAPEAVVRGAVLAVRQGIPVTLVGDTARLAPLIRLEDGHRDRGVHCC